MTKSQVKKYLACYGEPEVQLLEPSHIEYRYDKVAVIPAYDEPTDFLDRLLQHAPEPLFLLLILVINAPEPEQPQYQFAAARTASLTMLDQLQKPETLLWQSQNKQLQLHQRSSNIHLLLVDRCSSDREIPTRLGVGLARKIGADLACKLIDSGTVKSHWIHSSDADVTLPDSYWNQDFPASASAVAYPFKHRPTEHRYQLATALYEFSLHWYVLGLKWAGSPYAYHSVGSTLAINHESYAKVRGFPKRSAGEDFYILNKLRKISLVYQPESPMLEIQGRVSARVPFGTGPALKKILAQKNPADEFLFYHPNIFRLLRNWLALFPELGANPGWGLSEIAAKISEKKAHGCSTEHIYTVLSELKIDQALAHARRNSCNQQVFLRHMHTWFDAFRTLKFIHGLRNNALASLPFNQAVQHPQFFNNPALKDDWIMLAAVRLLVKIRSSL